MYDGYDYSQDDINFPLPCRGASATCTYHVFHISKDLMLRTQLLQEIVVRMPISQRTHKRLKVSIILRPGKFRRILNLPALQQVLLQSGLVQSTWLLSHSVYFENLSFQNQLDLLSQTDVLIAVHGAGIMNGVFMRPGSSVISMQSAHNLEFFFSSPLRECQVQLLHMAYGRNKNVTGCDESTPKKCFNFATDWEGNFIVNLTV